MLLWIWTRDDETGLLDDEFRDGDILLVKPDSFEASIGAQEKKSYLIIKIPDPPNMAKVTADLVRPEFAPPATVNGDPVVRRKRIYSLNWRAKFTSEEIAMIEDSTVAPTGDNFVNGVLQAGFAIGDLSRK